MTARRARRIAVWAVTTLALAGGAWLTGGRGGLGYFSPDTLEYRTQSEWTVAFGEVPVYRSRLAVRRNALLEMLQAEGYVVPIATAEPHWLCVMHWNDAWRYVNSSTVHKILMSRQEEMIAWTREYPACARVYWPEAFRLMRSDRVSDHELAGAILFGCCHCRTADEVEQCIAGIKTEAQYVPE
jgi:hypothetical protein